MAGHPDWSGTRCRSADSFLPFGAPDRAEPFLGRAPVIRRGHYSYSLNGLAVIGMLPRSPAEILAYIDRQYTPGVKDGLRGQPGIRKPPNFFRAHLTWYGVKWDESWTKDLMEDQLEKLLRRDPPPDICAEAREMERELKAEYREACRIGRMRKDNRVEHRRELSNAMLESFRTTMAATREALTARMDSERTSSPASMTYSYSNSPPVFSPASELEPNATTSAGKTSYAPVPPLSPPPIPSPSALQQPTPIFPSYDRDTSPPPSSSFYESPPRHVSNTSELSSTPYTFPPPASRSYSPYSEQLEQSPVSTFDYSAEYVPTIQHSPQVGYSFDFQYQSEPSLVRFGSNTHTTSFDYSQSTDDSNLYSHAYEESPAYSQPFDTADKYSSPPLDVSQVYYSSPPMEESTSSQMCSAPAPYGNHLTHYPLSFAPPPNYAAYATPPETPSPTISYPGFSRPVAAQGLSISPLDTAFVRSFIDDPDNFLVHHLPPLYPKNTVVLPFIHEVQRIHVVTIACEGYGLHVQSCESKQVREAGPFYDLVLGRDQEAVTMRRTLLMEENSYRNPM